MKKEFKPIAMKCTGEQFNAIKPILEANGGRISCIQSFITTPYLVNNLDNIQMCISNVSDSRIGKNNRTVFEEWNQGTFLEYCGIEKPSGYKFVVPATDVLEIHKIACNKWKHTIKCKYLSRISLEQNIVFTEQEVDEMFEAATSEQKPILTRIFGEKKKEIDYNRLKTGSKVMIDYSGQHCNGIGNIDKDKPVDIVFYNTIHYITGEGEFGIGSGSQRFVVFHQDGNFTMFRSDMTIDYITEVIEY